MEDKEVKIYPFSLESVEDEVAWGTESWKLSDLGFKDSTVRRGLLEGSTMSEVMETYMDRIVGDDVYYYYGRQFPVQIKQLQVKSLTPLLVCPDDIVASERYDALGKLKLWYVAQADADSKVYIGFNKDITATDFYQACLDGTIKDSLNEVNVRKDDCFMIKPGTVHCAGKGVTIVEISEASDLDLRICNWGKTSDSQDDPIFLEEAFDFVTMNREDPILVDPVKLADLEQFIATKVNLSEPLHISNGENGSFTVYYCLSGSASIQTPATNPEGQKYMENIVIKAGETALVPADNAEFYLVPDSAGTEMIEVIGGHIKREEMEMPETPAEHEKTWN